MFHCEWNDFGQKILKYYWPNAISYGDINKTDFSIWRGGIDVLTGGFPCQPFSLAGKRKGTEDDRHLWPRMLEVIREIQPTWVVGENVFGIVNWDGGMVFEQVQVDLEDAGYEVQPAILPAASVNAPHRRDRVWFVAHTKCSSKRQNRNSYKAQGRGDSPLQEKDEGRKSTSVFDNGLCNIQGASPDRKRSSKSGELQQRQGAGEFRGCDSYAAANANHQGLQRGKEQRGTGCCGEERDKQFGRCVSPAWEEFPTQPPICGRDDGIPRKLDGITFSKWRNESIKAYGNAVVPVLVYEIFKTIERYEKETHHR